MQRDARGASCIRLGLLVLTGLAAAPAFTQGSIDARDDRAGQETAGQETAGRSERAREGFAAARALLVGKGVPFEPYALLDPNWREQLGPTFAKMPEMRPGRAVILASRLRGTRVVIAHTVRLPARLVSDGDLIIVARNLVLDGANPEIVAPRHDVSLFIMDSFKHALNRKERLAAQSSGQRPKLSFSIRVGADPRRRGPSPDDQNENGMDGAPGENGQQGADGGEAGFTGPAAQGVCGTNGGQGEEGEMGNTGMGGGHGGNAGDGHDGTRAGNIPGLDIPASPEEVDLHYTAIGGRGGDGGQGGTGGAGGRGGTGGQGGKGVDRPPCNCAGSGGKGGEGGQGGRGGNGGWSGNGGNGGDGGQIMIITHCPNQHVFTNCAGGAPGVGGLGGIGGPGGPPGDGGDGGEPGDTGSGFSLCGRAIPGAHNNDNRGSGSPGSPGLVSGHAGQTGHANSTCGSVLDPPPDPAACGGGCRPPS